MIVCQTIPRSRKTCQTERQGWGCAAKVAQDFPTKWCTLFSELAFPHPWRSVLLQFRKLMSHRKRHGGSERDLLYFFFSLCSFYFCFCLKLSFLLYLETSSDSFSFIFVKMKKLFLVSQGSCPSAVPLLCITFCKAQLYKQSWKWEAENKPGPSDPESHLTTWSCLVLIKAVRTVIWPPPSHPV